VAQVWEQKLEEIKREFDFFDVDDNGLIDFKEFRKLLTTLSPRTSVDQAAEGFSIVDTNSDGHIDVDEFVTWWKSNWWEY